MKKIEKNYSLKDQPYNHSERITSFFFKFQITMYDIHLWKSLVSEDKLTRTTTERKAIFTDLDDNTEYQFQVRANTRKGPGPWSTKVSFRTDRNIIRAPLRVQVSVFFRIRVIRVPWEFIFQVAHLF